LINREIIKKLLTVFMCCNYFSNCNFFMFYMYNCHMIFVRFVVISIYLILIIFLDNLLDKFYLFYIFLDNLLDKFYLFYIFLGNLLDKFYLLYIFLDNLLHREKYHSTAKKSDFSVYFSFFK